MRCTEFTEVAGSGLHIAVVGRHATIKELLHLWLRQETERGTAFELGMCTLDRSIADAHQIDLFIRLATTTGDQREATNALLPVVAGLRHTGTGANYGIALS